MFFAQYQSVKKNQLRTSTSKKRSGKKTNDNKCKHTTTPKNLPEGKPERENKTFEIDLENTELSKEKVYKLFDKLMLIYISNI